MAKKKANPLDAAIEQEYYKQASGKQINVMDISNVYIYCKQHIAAGKSLEVAMAEAITVTLKGVDEVKKSLNDLGQALENNLDLNKELSTTLAQKASALAPRLTGALASSVQGNPSEKKAQILAGSSSVPYAGVQEYGWAERNIPAQPYLRPAVYNNIGYIIEKYNDSIDAAIKKYNLN
jgi:phage gpG-like protein